MDRTKAVEVLTKMLDCEDIDFCDSDCFKCRLFTRAVDRSNALIMAIKALGKDINVPSKSALDHIHNVVAENEYKRGYEQGLKDAPNTNVGKWIPVTPETLPEEGKVVVAYGDGKTWDVGMYHGHGNDITVWHWKKNTFKRVYWWMYKKDALPGQWKGK